MAPILKYLFLREEIGNFQKSTQSLLHILIRKAKPLYILLLNFLNVTQIWVCITHLRDGGVGWGTYTYYIQRIYIHICQIKKLSQPKSSELCFTWWEFLGLKPGTPASQGTLRELFWGGEGRGQVIHKFWKKGQVVWTSKDCC